MPRSSSRACSRDQSRIAGYSAKRIRSREGGNHVKRHPRNGKEDFKKDGKARSKLIVGGSRREKIHQQIGAAFHPNLGRDAAFYPAQWAKNRGIVGLCSFSEKEEHGEIVVESEFVDIIVVGRFHVVSGGDASAVCCSPFSSSPDRNHRLAVHLRDPGRRVGRPRQCTEGIQPLRLPRLLERPRGLGLCRALAGLAAASLGRQGGRLADARRRRAAVSEGPLERGVRV